jgi:hypothetical protein
MIGRHLSLSVCLRVIARKTITILTSLMANSDFTEHTITQAVLDRFANTPDARLKRIVQSLVRHAHDFIRDVELTESEWSAGIQFLAEAGHITDDKRKEDPWRPERSPQLPSETPGSFGKPATSTAPGSPRLPATPLPSMILRPARPSARFPN